MTKGGSSISLKRARLRTLPRIDCDGTRGGKRDRWRDGYLKWTDTEMEDTQKLNVWCI